MTFVPLRFAVSDSPELPSGEIASWAFPPHLAESKGPLDVVVAVPGGTYTKAYYHLEVPGHPGYSFAEYAADRGLLVIAVDNLGTGESTAPPDGAQVTADMMARALHQVVMQVRERLVSGTLLPGLAPKTALRITGVGHSLGGLVALLQQANHRSFDRLCILGYSTLGPGPEADELGLDARYGKVEAALAMMAPDSWDSGYLEIPRSYMRSGFTAETPAEVLAADDAEATVVPRTAAAQALTFGASSSAAAMVDVPVFLGFGADDLSPDPHREVGSYQASSDVTLLVVAGAAHCSNFAPTRTALWSRLVKWVQG